jgi:hypothetical protein
MQEKLSSFLKPLLKPKNAIIALVLLGLVIVGGTVVATRSGEGRIERVEISGQDKALVINENGIVEFRSGDEVYYQTLSSDRISSLFNYIRKKVKNPDKDLNADNPNVFTVTVTIDGEQTTILIDINDPELQDILGDIDDGIPGEETIGDYFDDEDEEGTGGDSETGGQVGTPTPTPTGGGSSGGTPTPSPSYYLPPGGTTTDVDCFDWSGQVTGRSIISNTVCFQQ